MNFEVIFKKLLRRCFKWASYVERMGDDKLARGRDTKCGGEDEARKTVIVMGGLREYT